MNHLNKRTIIGEVKDAPQYKETPNGTPVCTFTIYTETTHEGNKYPVKEWHNCVAWKELAEKANRMIVGEIFTVEGYTNTRSWEDKNTGQKKYKTEVVVESLARMSGSHPQTNAQDDAPIDASDVPF